MLKPATAIAFHFTIISLPQALIPPNNIVTSRFLDLLNHLLKWNPDERYTVKEALKHPFFALKIDDDEIAQANRSR